MTSRLVELLGYVLIVAVVGFLLHGLGYAMDLGPIEDPFDFTEMREQAQRRVIPSYDLDPPRVQSWMDNSGGITYFFNYGRTTMPVPLEQLIHPEKGPTFDPFGVIGQGQKDDGWLKMPKRRTK